MSSHATAPSGQEWLGLTHVAAVLGDRRVAGVTRRAPGTGDEIIDRLHRTLEILTLVEDHSDALRSHARRVTEHETMQLAVDLRRLANRLQTIGDSLSSAGDRVLELENELLLELDDRFRTQSLREYAA